MASQILLFIISIVLTNAKYGEFVTYLLICLKTDLNVMNYVTSLVYLFFPRLTWSQSTILSDVLSSGPRGAEMFDLLTLAFPVIAFVSVQRPHLPQCPGSEYRVSAGVQHSAVALPHPRPQDVPKAAAVLPPVDVREARQNFQHDQSLGCKQPFPLYKGSEILSYSY